MNTNDCMAKAVADQRSKLQTGGISFGGKTPAQHLKEVREQMAREEAKT